MPRTEFEAFTRLDASDVNTFLMDQSVMSFAGTAARGSAIATPVEGMVTYLEDSDLLSIYETGAWRTSVSPRGGVLQVVYNSTTTATTTTSTTFTNTALSATLTPKSATSKILVLVSQNGLTKINETAGGVNVRLLLPDSATHLFGFAMGFTDSVDYGITSASLSFLYTPANTSAQTFRTQVAARVGGTTAQVNGGSERSSITLMEIAS